MVDYRNTRGTNGFAFGSHSRPLSFDYFRGKNFLWPRFDTRSCRQNRSNGGLLNINIQVIPESQMRPEVNGADWFWDAEGNLQVRVCPMSDWRYETALAFHEAFEAALAKDAGVTQKQVDDFDQAYDLAHPDEPDLNAGDDPAAPYRAQHNYATIVDRLFIGACGLNWKDYDDELAKTYPGPSKKAK